LLGGALGAAALLAWAGSQASRTPLEQASPPERTAAGPAPRSRGLPQVRTLLEQGSSAYHARLLADERAVVLVTQTGFTTVSAEGPAQEHAIALGPVVARHGETLAFWRAGSLREVSIFGGPERVRVALPRPPRYLFTSEQRLAWIQTDAQTGTSLQTLVAGHVRSLYESLGDVAAPILHGAHLYWVAASHDRASWKIGRFDLEGRGLTWSALQHARPPAMLAVGHDGVYFYSGPRRGVRRLSFDLQRESSVAEGVVCSPLALSDRVLCAQVGGLFQVPLSGAAPAFLASERAGPITALALTGAGAFWVAENGAERLLLRTVTLSEP
jgi:hypothetical protein